ncbi:MAG: ChpI protein [Acidobacteriota bacterium]
MTFWYNSGYTLAVKTAVSIPTPLFKAAEGLARRMHISRSKLYADALNEFVRARSSERITEALDRVYGIEPSSVDPVLAELQNLTIARAGNR